MKTENPGDFAQGLSLDRSRDLAYIRPDDCAPSLRAPGCISLFEEGHESAAAADDVMLGDEIDPGLIMRTRSWRLKREDNEQSECHRDLPPNIDGQGESEIPEVSTVEATTGNETEGQFLKTILHPEHREASHGDAARSHAPGRSSSRTEMNKTKEHRISQKSKKWFREHLVQLKRIWKG